MNESFYVAAIGADQCTNRLSVIANNLANVNNHGFRPKATAFSELIEYNVNDSEEAVTELQAGASTKVARTYTSFDVCALTQTNSACDFAILEKNAFFMLRDPVSGAITYTRDGHFYRAKWGDEENEYYLMTDSGKLVLDQNQEPLKADVTDVEKIQRQSSPDYEEDDEDDDEEDDEDAPRLCLYTFENPSRLLHVSGNEYVPADADAEPILIEHGKFMDHALEASGTDVATEFSHLIECQRAFSFALRMVTTSDEITSTINNLRA